MIVSREEEKVFQFSPKNGKKTFPPPSPSHPRDEVLFYFSSIFKILRRTLHVRICGKGGGRLPHGIFHPLDLFIPRARPSPRSVCSLARWQKKRPLLRLFTLLFALP